MTISLERRPGAEEYSPSQAGYVDRVPEGNLLEILSRQQAEIRDLLSPLSASRADHRYAPGKWSVKEVLGHLLDAERIFAYRALCVARGERRSLPGFEENEYAANSDLSTATLADLLEQFNHVRRSNILLFRSFPEPAWARRGTANGSAVTPRGIAFVIAGHASHHVEILHKRYLSAENG